MRATLFANFVLVAFSDGSPETTAYSTLLGSLCVTIPSSRQAAVDTALLTLTQTSFRSIRIAVTNSEIPLALYVTDAEGTVLNLAQSTSNTTLTLPLEAASQPQRFVPHALFAKCTLITGAGVDNWQSRINSFDYGAAMAMGGTHAHGTMPALDEAALERAVPHLAMATDGRSALLTMRQLPSLFVPMVYLKCSTTAVVWMHTFERTAWPPSGGLYTAMDDGWWGDWGCTRLFACAAMPARENCGGFPQRCTELDLVPTIVARIEKGATLGAHAAPLAAVARVSSGPRLTVHVETCDGARVYLKDAPSPTGNVLAFAKGDIGLSLAPNASSSGHSIPAAVWVFRACGPADRVPSVTRSAAIRLPPLIARFHVEAEADATTRREAAARVAPSAAVSSPIATGGTLGGTPRARPPPLALERRTHTAAKDGHAPRPPLVPRVLRVAVAGLLVLAVGLTALKLRFGSSTTHFLDSSWLCIACPPCFRGVHAYSSTHAADPVEDAVA